MRHKTATAMALAVIAGVVGLGAMPVMASHENCHGGFNIADAEISGGRTLSASSEEVGVEDVSALTGDETLNVRLESADDELEWTVYHMSGGSCVTFDDCKQGANWPNEITAQNGGQSCRLDAPTSGTKDYFVKFVNPQGDALDYRAWCSPAI